MAQSVLAIILSCVKEYSVSSASLIAMLVLLGFERVCELWKIKFRSASK